MSVPAFALAGADVVAALDAVLGGKQEILEAEPGVVECAFPGHSCGL